MSSAVAGPSKPTKKKITPTPVKKHPKSKAKSAAVVAEVEEDDAPIASASEPKYEGTNTGLAYQPPKGAVLANHADVDAGVFDYDALKGDDNLELWIVRVPNAVSLL